MEDAGVVRPVPHEPGGLGSEYPGAERAVLAIHQLKHAYFRFLDLKQFHELGQLLTEDATASYVDGTEILEGRAAIVAFLEDGLSDPGIVSMHQGHHPEITVADDGTATGVWYLLDRVILLEHDLEVGGTAFYQDTYVRTADGWRISHTGYRRVFEEHRHHRSGERIFFKSRFQPS